ncbi:aryl-alcohol dehydrogenase-like predicted oxidoreductase [Rhodopseudomonas julia]|uniref:Aryl-alcohol dehydrogenase-like predicted oxidoreductase n=1 Tax=Rhodopseudomonas julia TaxID=200617 RepID=A0ABU0C7X2_9BRAD|nr:aldo/keto reductase [Rhodopseudomonas julia]MDQ0325745.1 aryl-alcohol dehydrogenase-like predicted oxidoreductase [Rhodopseudomonas julia]
MDKRLLGRTGLEISPVVFGGNVFGWTADEATSFDLLDQMLDLGLDTIDTADVYSAWVDGNKGGESETIIGKWLKADPSRRDKIVLFTKVGSEMGEGKKGLSERWIMRAVEDSLARLNTDYIDLYFSHWPDADTPYEETLGAYDKLLKAGKIRAVGASNLDAAQLGEALKVAEDKGLPRYEVLQPEYNLYDRSKFDGALRDLVMREEIGVVTYYSLASGFLSGKYRSKEDLSKSKRGAGVAKYLDDRGMRILDALDKVGAAHEAKPAEVALAWVIARKGVTAPIASATSREQLQSLAKAAELQLSADDVRMLDEASR